MNTWSVPVTHGQEEDHHLDMVDASLVAGAHTELGNVVPHRHAGLSRGGPWHGHAAADQHDWCPGLPVRKEPQDLLVLHIIGSNA